MVRFKTKFIIFLCGTALSMFIGGIIADFQNQSLLANCPSCAICIGCAEYRKAYYTTIGMVIGGISTIIIILLIPPSQEEKEQKVLKERLLAKLRE